MSTEPPRRSISDIALLSWGLIILMIIVVLTGSGVITTKSGCQDRVNTDPKYQYGANWYGLGLGFCLAE